MKFILVNDRAPFKKNSCVLCGEPIGTRYLREIGTQLFYCDYDCYTGHCESAVRALADFTKPYSVALAPHQVKALPEAELTAK
jgi:hypothetical protein